MAEIENKLFCNTPWNAQPRQCISRKTMEVIMLTYQKLIPDFCSAGWMTPRNVNSSAIGVPVITQKNVNDVAKLNMT
jgi:hypothetical protein